MDVHKQRQEISHTARPQRPASNRKPPVSRPRAPHPLHYPLSNLRPNLDPQAWHKVLCRGCLTCRGTREVLKDYDTIFANRDVPAVSTTMPYGGRDIVFTPYGPEWNMLRKVCVRDMLGTATLDAVYSLRHREIKNTVVYLYNRVGSPVNVGEQTHVKVLLRDMVVGGTDTTSNTVEFSMAEMLNKPKVTRKSQQELDTVIGKTITLEEPDIHKLPYLNAVFKEVLRLHPVLPLMVPHCPSESCIIGGYTIPKGARVFVNVM
ncbi:hypothetical protein HYC85_026673 [Camellia sinensis]|uniref:Cytochrome P450 n=1 Tax=Camellia sinensis TaxID=4442 RepID=A0A7J7G881_CAMSI|nr:hypothetical protein HYC85_026673 [Camellia sinensis]